MRLRRLLAAAAAAAAAISVGGFAAIPTAGATGNNTNIEKLAIGSYVGPYSSNPCQKMNVSGGTAYVDTSTPYINIDVLGAGTGDSCPVIVSAFLNTDVQVVSNSGGRLLTLTGTADLSEYGYSGLQTVTLSYQAVGKPSHSVDVQPPGPGISISSVLESECTATLTISNAEGQVEATYSSNEFPGNYSDCFLASAIASASSN